ncbi:MAG: T9SS type A sorting domain-containing protein [Bacteroidetes bacterium]|nr:T9SS type A sorting domain-containing protein [Bacteroidota bacterium]
MTKKSLSIILVLFLFSATSAYSQLLNENFNYPVGDSVSAHGWNGHSGFLTNNILVGSPGLEFPGYFVTGGNAALVNNTGQDINKTFDSVSAGSVYASFLLKVTAAPVTGYFFHLGRNPFNTFDFRARVWAKPEGANYRLGISFSGNADTIFSTGTYNIDSTYLVVVKYKVEAAADDSVSLYVFKPGDNITAEPAVPTAGPKSTTGGDISPGAVALRQYNAAQRFTVDNILVSTSWMLSIVPVEFTSFSATSQNGKVNLAWETASETNNKGFEVQRSLDNQNFSNVGYVTGKGTTTKTSSYAFTDDFSVSGKVYYRLKQIDFDGTSAFSNTIEVESNMITGFELFQNYPNPFNPSTSINFTVSESGLATLKIFSVTGEEVANLFSQSVEKGTVYTVNFNAANLNSGVYFAQLSQGNNVKNIKLILNK